MKEIIVLKKELLDFLEANNNFGLEQPQEIVDSYISEYKKRDQSLSDKNVHIVPTDKLSVLFNDNKGEFHFREQFAPDVIQTCKNHNIYITSDEVIEDCWVFNTHINQIYYCNGFYGTQPIAKKIIRTTDYDLISYGVKPIHNDFLKWFVNNPSCEQVDINKAHENFPTTFKLEQNV